MEFSHDCHTFRSPSPPLAVITSYSIHYTKLYDCNSSRIEKQIMAPAVKTTKGREAQQDPEQEFAAFAAKARQLVAENFDYVGDGFAEEARSMFYGEQAERPIWGETTEEEREA